MALFRAACATALPLLAAAAGPHTERLSPGGRHTLAETAARRALAAGTGGAGAAAAAAAAAPGLSMLATPATAQGSVATLNVSWTGAPSPQSTDWVAVYCVGAPISEWGQWVYVTDAPSYASGSGFLSFLVARSCGAVEFRMYRDPSPYALLGASNAITWAGGSGAGPFQHRVAYGDEPQTMVTVSWTDMGALDAGAVVMLGASPGSYELGNFTPALGSPLSYAATDLCTPPANTTGPDHWQFPGVFYHVPLANLSPSTRYFYRAVSNGVASATEFNFVTAKPLGADVATRFVLTADMSESGAPGAVDTSARITQRVTTLDDLDFLVHIGDLSYAEGNVAVWNVWMGLIEPYAARLPYHVSVGNHEYDYEGVTSKDPSGATQQWRPSWFNGFTDGGGECGVGTDRRFRMPQTSSSNRVFWYSFNTGNVHIAMISSEHDPSPDAPMGSWLVSDLAAVNRSLTPWVFVNIHRPLVETEKYAGDYLVAKNLFKTMMPYLLKYGVDVVGAGHYHSFQRSCFVGASYSCVPGGPGNGANSGIVHYTSGAAGAGLDEVGLYDDPVIEKTILGSWGYSVVEAANATAMRLTFYRNVDNAIEDDVWIYKTAA